MKLNGLHTRKIPALDGDNAPIGCEDMFDNMPDIDEVPKDLCNRLASPSRPTNPMEKACRAN